LGIDKSASNDEIKKAYRKMAVKHHPDKFNQLGEEQQIAAKKKFQKIQEKQVVVQLFFSGLYIQKV
jgi:DnaJ like chaperone protein